MATFTIATAYCAPETRRRLALELKFLEQEGYPVRVVEGTAGGVTWFQCTADPRHGTRPSRVRHPAECPRAECPRQPARRAPGGSGAGQPGRSAAPQPRRLPQGATWPADGEGRARGLLRHFLANAVSDVIVNGWERELLDRMVRRQYAYFSPDEQRQVAEAALRGLYAGDAGDGAVLSKIGRKGRILRLVSDYLAEWPLLVIEGFVTFRLRDYLLDLEQALDEAADDFVVEREYREFVGLLRTFVDSQEPKLDEVHVVLGPEERFKLVDAADNAVNHDDLASCVADITGGEISGDDLLVSALITIAPRTVVLHPGGGWRQREVLRTIDAVFQSRVRRCSGCRLCQGHPTARLKEPWSRR